MGRGTAPTSADDPSIKGTETIWRLFQDRWHQPDPNSGKKEFDEALFIGQVSALRAGMVTETDINTVYGGIFAKHGIVELTADEIRQLNCILKIDSMQPPPGQTGWPKDAHIVIGKPPTGSRIRLKDKQAGDLTDLANQK